MDGERFEWLRNRWESDVVNRIVIVLNEGQSIDTILKAVPQSRKYPPVPDRLDLRGIDLSHQNLRGPWELREGKYIHAGIDLSRADLTGAILRWVILPRADLRGTVLRYADLTDAELILSDLSQADLTGADLRGAWFLDTKFYGAKITEEQLASRRSLGQLDFEYHAYEI